MSNIVLFDTCIYIPLIRQGKLLEFANQNSEKDVYLSVIVAQELYAGVQDPFTKRALHHFYSVFKKHNFLITPSEQEWVFCGEILSEVGKQYGFEIIKKSRLVNDVLIALSCKRIDATLITSNLKDFKIIQDFVKFQFTSPD